jgi:hypothetical protein
MSGRKVVLYHAWSRPGEAGAPIGVIENRYQALFEIRRILYPRFEDLSDPARFDQSVNGYLGKVMKQNFAAFLKQVGAQTGHPVVEIERVADDGTEIGLDAALADGADTLIVISLDCLRTHQQASAAEVEAVRRFLAHPDHLVFICPHHDVGDVPDLPDDERLKRQVADFLHHGDRTLPPQHRLSGFARSLLAGLGVGVENRFGLHAAADSDGSPAAIEVETALDRLSLLRGVHTFSLHPHLPQFERLPGTRTNLDVLVRQKIDLTAPPHPFTRNGRTTFDALLQSRPGIFVGNLLVGDVTLFFSTAGGVDSLRQLWTNIVERPNILHSRT